MLVVDQIIRPRLERGINWAHPQRVLVRHADGRELRWHPGSSVWCGIGAPAEWHAGTLTCHTDDPREFLGNDLESHTVIAGSVPRFGRKLFLHYATEINAFFGEPIADRIHPKKTLIVGEGP